MGELTFGFMRDYASARGLTLEKTEQGYYRLGNPIGGPDGKGRWQRFDTLKELREHYYQCM